jgi:hypothetical protein
VNIEARGGKCEKGFHVHAKSVLRLNINHKSFTKEEESADNMGDP